MEAPSNEIGDQMRMREKYEIKEAMETLIRAEEIKSDKSLMKDIARCAADQKKAIESIEDIKSAYDKMVMEEDDEEEMEEEDTPTASSKRYAQAKKEANMPEIPMVKPVKDA